jgi:hypothetical protein
VLEVVSRLPRREEIARTISGAMVALQSGLVPAPRSHPIGRTMAAFPVRR